MRPAKSLIYAIFVMSIEISCEKQSDAPETGADKAQLED